MTNKISNYLALIVVIVSASNILFLSIHTEIIFAKFQRGSRVGGHPAGGIKTLGQSRAERGREKKKSKTILFLWERYSYASQYIMNFEKMSRGFFKHL